MALDSRDSVSTSAILRFGTFEVDVRERELRKQGKLIRLQDQPFQVLFILLQRPGEVVGRDELRRQIWPQNTFVDFDNSLSAAVNKLREALGDSADRPRFIETLPRRGYRFIAPVGADEPSKSRVSAASWQIPLFVSVVAVAAAGLAVAVLWRSREPRRLTEKDTIVLGEFANTTNDPVFDGTLREGLSVQITQSPFLSLASEDGIHQTLRLMGKAVDTRLTPEVAREVCQRMNSVIALDGSIAQIGSRYDLILRAVDCANGDSLAGAEAQANDKSRVLDALQSIAAEMRKKLGESSVTIQKYNVRLEQVTTPSLEALQAYSLGFQSLEDGNASAAVGSLKRAVSLDPNFAIAYAALGTAYGPLGETSLAIENTRKAYDLRDRVSEREKFYISSHYEENVTGNTEKAGQVYELWAQTYPRDVVPVARLGFYYAALGQYDKSLAQGRRALELAPDRGVAYEILAAGYLNLDRLDESETVIQQAKARGIDTPPLHEDGYALAFLKGDLAGMARETAWAAGRPGIEDRFIFVASETLACAGQLTQANAMTVRAAAMAREAGENETAADYLAEAALREALVGNRAEARRRASAAWQASNGEDTRAALALALAGDLARPRKFADDLARRPPQDAVDASTIRAAIALEEKDPARAIADLQGASPFELGDANELTLYPVYVRGQAYLAAHQGAAAVAEFQKILDHPGLALNEMIFPLARLGLGRARVLAGQTSGGRKSYGEFFTLWQHADPNLPVLLRAKTEFVRLH